VDGSGMGANKIDNSLPLIGFLIGGGFCCFEIDKGAADITVKDVVIFIHSYFILHAISINAIILLTNKGGD
jgi:hypothetical protein